MNSSFNKFAKNKSS